MEESVLMESMTVLLREVRCADQYLLNILSLAIFTLEFQFLLVFMAAYARQPV